MRLTRNKIFTRVSLAILLSFLPVFASMDLASAQTRPEIITELQQAQSSYAQRFDEAQRRIVYMYNLPVDASPFLNAYNQYGYAISQLYVDHANIVTAEQNLQAAQDELAALPTLISTSDSVVQTASTELTNAQAAYDSISPTYNQAVADRDAAYSNYQSSQTGGTSTEYFTGLAISTDIEVLVDGSTPITTTGTTRLQNYNYSPNVTGGTIFFDQNSSALQIKSAPASQVSFYTAAKNGDQYVTVTFDDGSTASLLNPNGVGNANCPNYECLISYTAPSGKLIQSITFPSSGYDIWLLDGISFTTASYDPAAYQTYLDAQAYLDSITPDYNATYAALTSAQSTYDSAVAYYATVSSQQYQDQLSTNVQTRQQELDTANNDWTISYNDALTKQNDALVELVAYEAEVPPVPQAPTFADNTVAYYADEGWTINITAPQGAYLTNVVFASYGTPDNFNIAACHAPSTSAVIQSIIDNANQPNSITLSVTNETFTDPCSGTPKWFQAVVEYEYVPALIAPTNIDAQYNSDGSVTLTWDPAQTVGTATVERYAIFFTDGISAGWAVSSTTTSITIDPIVFEQTGGLDATYSFKVRADNDTDAIYSGFSDPVQASEYVAPPLTPEEIAAAEEAAAAEAQRIEDARIAEALRQARLAYEAWLAEQAAIAEAERVAAEEAAAAAAAEAERIAAEEAAAAASASATASPEPTPTPTPTPSETTTPEPTPTTEPEPTVEPTPTPDPSSSVDPEPTPTVPAQPSPTPTPTPTPTVTPTPTPTPSVTPTPTPTETKPTPSSTPTPSETPKPTPTPEPTKEPTPTEKPVVVELDEPITSENIEALVEELATIEPQQLTEEQQELIVEAALETFETAQPGSEEYEAALDALLVVAQADDIVIDEELAAVPVVGAAVVAVADAINAIGNAGADMSPQVREQSEKVVIAAVIVGQVAMTATAAATSAAASAARRP